jgi:hypothetical protein
MASQSVPEVAPDPIESEVEGLTTQQRAAAIGGIIVLLLLIAGSVFAVIAMLQNPEGTETIRDVVIIFVAVEALIIGVVLVLLIVQLARLTALIQNEVTPILKSTNETINTLRGTSEFLSDNMVKPVMKANSTAAALRKVLSLLGIGRGN